jgi:nitric oxide reductase subunit C
MGIAIAHLSWPMLSKSAARAFFVGGTVVCSVAFIGLTVDTFRQVPKLTNSENITPAVAHGKALFEEHNCMGCHTILGEGAYYAPELTKVYERRGEAFIRAMLKDPEGMYPGQRKMQRVDLTEKEMDDLVAFLKWIGEMNLQGFPPTPTLNPIAVPTAAGGTPAVAGISNRPQVYNQLCIACHALGGQGGAVGPPLDMVGAKYDADYINKWLHDPKSVKADAKMPKLPMTDEQIDELTAFLSQLKAEVKP